MSINIQSVINEDLQTITLSPIGSIMTGVINSYESILSCGTADGVVDQSVLLVTASESDKFTQYLEYSIEKIVRNVLDQDIHHSVFVPFDLSILISHPEIPKVLSDKIDKRIPNEQIVLHFHVDRSIDVLAESLALLDEIANQGFRISINRLGLCEFTAARKLMGKIDFVKVPMPSYDSLVECQVTMSMVKSIVNLCRISGKELIADGVDSERLVEALHRYGIDTCQGTQLTKSSGSDLKCLDQQRTDLGVKITTIGDILTLAPPISSNSSIISVKKRFAADDDLKAVVVQGEEMQDIAGIITRESIYDWYLKRGILSPFKESFSVAPLIENNFTKIESSVDCNEAGEILRDTKTRSGVFVITERGQYQGIGDSYDLLAGLA